MADEFTHLNSAGEAHMVDVGSKDVTVREATALARVHMSPETVRKIQEGGLDKGDVFATARIAGIMAAKRTHELIPLCHPLPITHVQVGLDAAVKGQDGEVSIRATVRTTGRTGVEMEALTAASVAALTVYDMCKSVDRAMTIAEMLLFEKKGGRSGHFVHPQADPPDGGE